MILQNWWYTTLLNTTSKFCDPLQEKISTDVLVVGGGMAGLHCALSLITSGKKVVLLEKNICGGSSTGKAAGFLTPESELSIAEVQRRYGPNHAKNIWSIPEQGAQHIVNTIKKYRLKCDLLEQDSLYLGIKGAGLKAIEDEAKIRSKLNMKFKLHRGESLMKVNTGKDYTSGLQYGPTYAINPLLYAQELKKVLMKKGVKIYESSQVENIKGSTAFTHQGSVKAKEIVMCIDKVENTLSEISPNVYHAQTFMSVSEPLKQKDIKAMFPTDKVQCWDNKLVYTYYRLTGDNRLLVGGGSALTTFTPYYVNSPRVIENVQKNLRKQFPVLNRIEFIQYWPGYIDTTKDLMPIVDFDTGSPHVQYVVGNVGLPWAAFCGDFAARMILNRKSCTPFRRYLSKNRKFFINRAVQAVLRKPLTFALNNSYSIFLQKDKEFRQDK